MFQMFVVMLILIPELTSSLDVTSSDDDVCVSQDVVYQIGERWNPNVQGFGLMVCMVCLCKKTATVSCKSVQCPTVTKCQNPKRIPGKCCPVCPTHHSMAPMSVSFQSKFPFGEDYEENQIAGSARVISSRDRVFGSRGNIGAGINPSVAPKIEQQCTKNFISWQHGEFFPNPDGFRVAKQLNKCSLCVCLKGEIYCRIKQCPKITCLNPTRPTSGDCCPQCRKVEPSIPQIGSNLRSESTSEPDHFVNSNMGSTSGAESTNRQDNLQNVLLPFITDTIDVNRPENSHKIPVNLNPTEAIKEKAELKSCQSGSMTYAHGDVWLPSLPQIRDRSCIECNCDNGKVKCKIPKCPKTFPCRSPVTSSNKCCKVCPSDVILTPPIKNQEIQSIKTVQNPTTKSVETATPCVDSGPKIFRFIKSNDVINQSLSLMANNNDDVSNLVLAIRLTKLSTRVYNWTVNKDTKQRQVITMRPNIFRRYEESNEKFGKFVLIGNTTKKQLEIFARKEKRWSRTCRRDCERRINRIMTSLKLTPPSQSCVTA